jgi:hypothetical protein
MQMGRRMTDDQTTASLARRVICGRGLWVKEKSVCGFSRQDKRKS